MSDYFIQKLNKKTKCPGCKNGKLVVGKRVYSLCQNHLAYARVKWREFAANCKAKGRCLHCPKMGWLVRKLDGKTRWCRCEKHTMENRKKMQAWTEKQLAYNPNYFHDKYVLLFNEYTAKGLCTCTAHAPVQPGFTRCGPCRDKTRRARKAGGTILTPRGQYRHHR